MMPRPLSLRLSLALITLLGLVLGARFVAGRPPAEVRVLVPALPGDGALAILPDGRTLLIDGAADGAALSTWLGNTLPFGTRKLDAIVLTRADAATLPGQLAALKRYQIGRALLAATERPSSSLDAWWQLVEQQGAPAQAITTGDRLALGVCQLDVLGEHEDQLTLALRCGATSVYFLQSIDDGGEALLAAHTFPPAQLIVYPWRRTTDTPLLSRLQPHALLFSEGGDQDLQRTWADRQVGNAQLFHEELNGQLELRTDGQAVEIMVERP